MKRPLSLITLVVVALLLLFPLVWGSPDGEGSTQQDLQEVLYALVIILLAAKLGGELMERWGQPAVLGELVFGVILGNAYLIGIPWFEMLKGNEAVTIMAEIGVIILLFEVGLESTLKDMLKVGTTSLLVASLGIVAPFFLGWGVAAWFLPAESVYVHVFVGATLTATSVGITARVLQDIDQIKRIESRIILGAAVIDDILGLVILAVVTGLINAADAGQGGVSSWAILWIVAKAVLFLFGAVYLGGYFVPRVLLAALKLRGRGIILTLALVFCFAMAWLAKAAGLASIVGAYAAGLILDDVHCRPTKHRDRYLLEELLAPLAVFLTPIFFVAMGLAVDLRTFAQTDVLLFALALTIAAIVGKQASALGVTGKRRNRWAIGLGMIPRGEVGLIFASIGAGLYIQGHPVISSAVYSAVVIMVIVTTMITPPLLKRALEKPDKAAK